jgi:hypothetical protein
MDKDKRHPDYREITGGKDNFFHLGEPALLGR